MSQRRSEYPRQDGEDYRTPTWVAAPIARHLRKRNVANVWEPANGAGHLTAALEAERLTVFPTGGNFLERATTPNMMDIDAIVTNPPYGEKGRNELAVDFIRHALTFPVRVVAMLLTVDFIRHALTFPVRVVAMLLTVDFDSAKTRADLFRDNRRFAGKIVLLDRIVWFERPGAAPSANHAWFVWEGYQRHPRIAYAGKAT